jgi:Cu/Ag efflux pump CusA
MTTIAMVAGMLPIAISLTRDSSWRAPMGVTVIGGLIFSTALTLLLVPSYFSIAVDLEKWVAKMFLRVVDNGEEHVPMAEPLPAE